MTEQEGTALFRRFAADFTARWWVVFALVIVLPSLALSLVSLRLIERLASDEVSNLVRASEAVPWYMEQKMNRALEARALHAARLVGYEALKDPEKARERLEAVEPHLFDLLTIDDGAHPVPVPEAPRGEVVMATTSDDALALGDAGGGRTGTLRYRYSKEGVKQVLRECFNSLEAPWNDDSLEFFVGGPTEGRFAQGFDLHLNVRVNDRFVWERQGRTQDIRSASALTDDGYSVEIAIPWRHIGVRPVAGASFRFDITNNDDDDGGIREGQRTWAGHSRNWVDPLALGTLRIGPLDRPQKAAEAVVNPTAQDVDIDGHLAEADWKITNQADKTEGRTDNIVRFGALSTPNELVIGVKVVDGQVVNDHSREAVEWVLRIVDPEGSVLFDSGPEAGQVFGLGSEAIDLRHLISLGALKGSQILFAFRDRPITRRIGRWKLGAAALIVGMDVLLGFGLWLVYTNVKREMDLAALKSHFVATVSHEFKAPLALLQASAETLRGRVLDDEKRRRYEGIIEAESRRLAALVDNVLTVSRIEAGRKYQFVPTDVSSVVEAALSLHRLKLEQQGFDVDVNVDHDLPPMTADGAALQEALSNLIDNAIKYSRDRKRCCIEARAVGARLEISVADSGLGISTDDKEKIFERFYRGEREGHGEKGVGLGLSIARDILRAHGGDVRVESVPGRGTTFTLILPIAEKAA